MMDKVYRVIVTENDEDRFYGMAIGLRPATKGLPYPHTEDAPAMEWIPNSSTRYMDYAFLRLLETDGDDMIYIDTLAALNGTHIEYAFEYLTLDRLREVSSEVVGDLLSELQSDDEVQEFFVQDYLRDGWAAGTE